MSVGKCFDMSKTFNVIGLKGLYPLIFKVRGLKLKISNKNKIQFRAQVEGLRIFIAQYLIR